MLTWPQLYDPFGSWLLSTAVSAFPVVTLFFVLVVLKSAGLDSALSRLMVAVALALWCSACRRCWSPRPPGTASSSG